MKKYLKLLRVHHYIKNILVLTPIFFSSQIFDIKLLRVSVLGFISFCLISSCVYILNDICDVEKDRLHPTKCHRPIANGSIAVSKAWVIFTIVFILSLAIGFTYSLLAVLLLLVYFAINLAYSVNLKNVPIVDICILMFGFLLRVFYGSIITGIPVSDWLYLTVVTTAFYFGLGKRRNEMKFSKGETRKVLTYYTYDFLDKNMYMFLGLTITFYSLWCITQEGNMVATIPLVMIILMKYSLNIEGASDGDPVEVVLKDKLLISLILIYGISVFALTYI